MEQDRDTRDAGIPGIGYRLAAPALRAKQRQNVNQSVLDFADPGWDVGPRAPDIGDVAQDRWQASEEPAFSVAALLDQVRDLPWDRYVGSARRASLIGAMGAVGFAFVMYQALPRKAETLHPPKTAPVAVAAAAMADVPQAAPPAVAETPRPAADPSTPAPALAAPEVASAAAPVPAAAAAPAAPVMANPAAGQGVMPAAAAATATMALHAEAPAQALPPAVAAPAGPAAVGAHPGVLREAARNAVAPRAAAPRHAVKAPVRVAVQTRPNMQLWRPIGRLRPAVTLAQAQPARAPLHRVTVARGELPRWLTDPRPASPRVIVMSEPPHNLTLPPSLQHEAMATAPPRVPGIVLPALRAPGYNAAPSFTQPRYSGVYYGGFVPPPVPSEPQG
jgi:hypothetical protein